MRADPEGFVEYSIVRLAEQLQRRFADVLRPHGLSMHQFSCSAVLSSRPGSTAAELARAVLVTPQSMGALLDQLDEKGLIEPRERRGRGVRAPAVLSAAGREVLEAAMVAVRALDRETREVLGEDTEAVRSGLERLRTRLEG